MTSHHATAGPSLGCWCRLESPFVAQALARSGFDWLCLDMQHGVAGYRDVSFMAQCLDAASKDLYVRVPWNDASAIMKALDAGATGIIVPMIETAADVEAAVSASRYPPLGKRSFAGLGRGAGDPVEANRSIKCGVMIETAAALDELTQILSVPGLDFVLVGPDDLSLSCGLDGSGDAAERARNEILESISAACAAHGVVPGIFCGDAASTLYWAARGYGMLAVATDVSLLANATASVLSAIREGLTAGS